MMRSPGLGALKFLDIQMLLDSGELGMEEACGLRMMSMGLENGNSCFA